MSVATSPKVCVHNDAQCGTTYHQGIANGIYTSLDGVCTVAREGMTTPRSACMLGDEGHDGR